MITKKRAHPGIERISMAALVLICMLFNMGCTKNSGNSSVGEGMNEPAVPGVTPVLVPVEGYSVYENPEFAIRVQYPGEWEKIEGEFGVAFIIPGEEEKGEDIFEGFNLLFEEMHGAKMSLEQYMRLTREGMKKYMPGFNLIESSESTLGEHPAVRMTFTGVHESMTMKFLSMFAIRKGKIYSLSFNTFPERFDSFLDTVEKIIASFQFLS